MDSVVEAGCDGYRFTFFDSIFCVVTMWHQEKSSRLKTWEEDFEEAITHRQTYTRVYELYVPTPQIASIGMGDN